MKSFLVAYIPAPTPPAAVREFNALPSPLATFLTDPTTILSVAGFRALDSYDLATRQELVLHYITIAHAESQFNTGALSKTSSAQGQLQIINATYKEALRLGKIRLKRSASYLPTLGDFYIKHLIDGDKWSVQNRVLPQYDMTQWIANVGLITDTFDHVNSLWSYSVKNGWTTAMHKSMPLSLMSSYHATLMNKTAGRQLLMTYYHINGPYADNLKTLSHSARLVEDPTYFSYLEKLGNVYNHAVLVTDSVLQPVYLAASSPTNVDVDAYNAYLKAAFSGRIINNPGPVVMTTPSERVSKPSFLTRIARSAATSILLPKRYYDRYIGGNYQTTLSAPFSGEIRYVAGAKKGLILIRSDGAQVTYTGLTTVFIPASSYVQAGQTLGYAKGQVCVIATKPGAGAVDPFALDPHVKYSLNRK